MSGTKRRNRESLRMARDGDNKNITLEEWRIENVKHLEIMRGDSYVISLINFGNGKLKFVMIDPRDLDILDRNRIHAKILGPQEISDMKKWLAINFL